MSAVLLVRGGMDPGEKFKGTPRMSDQAAREQSVQLQSVTLGTQVEMALELNGRW